jgi:tetratricopeptide (TPR) repeat protein
MGRYFLGNMSKAGFNKGEEYFKHALEEDSTYAPALSGLALIWGSRKQMGFISPMEADPKMRNYLERAVLADNTVAEVWATKAALMVWTDYDFEGGEKAFLRSIELNPNLSITRAGYAHLLMILNRWDEAWEQMNYAMEIDPLNPIIIAFSGILYSFQGKFLSATKKFEEITAMVPDHAMANGYLFRKYSRTFQYSKAVVELKKFVGSYLPNKEALIDETYASGGYTAAVRRTAEALTERAKLSFVPPSKIAMLYQSIGDTENRLHWIEEMYNQKSPGLPYLAIKTGAAIQDDPRYISIMKKAGFW